jgi:hypothetical protein
MKLFQPIILVLLVISLFTACFNKSKEEQDSIITPRIEDKSAPFIDLGKPHLVNVNDPTIKNFWPELTTVYNTGDSFELNASFRDDRKLERFWFEIKPVLQFSVDNSAWEYYDLTFLSGTIRGFNKKYKIPQSADGGFYSITIGCRDSAGNEATPVQTYFRMLNTYDGQLPLIQMSTLDTNNYNNNFFSIGGTVNIDGAITDNISVKYLDVLIRNKNSQNHVATLLTQDQLYVSPAPITSSWTIPAGTPLGWYQAVVRTADRYNNVDSLVVEFRVQP